MSSHPTNARCGNDASNVSAESMVATEHVRTGKVRPSRMGPKRAFVLIAVHVLAFAHILHWKLAGRTLTPLEPSEAMYTLVDGAVNAGAIVMLGSLALTLIFGRFFCGWACHLVAVQDGCAWILKKLHLRPRPLRSRWLMFVPLGVGLYMFGWPLLVRWWTGGSAPEWRAGFTETEFWDTFPGFWVGLITFFISGAAMVWVLGAKGFCTYACPYGGLFGVVDRFAPMRIVVSDACKGCGHCSAVCTSNVLVHAEVRDYGKVVDAGCMKCLDCVSVCPEGALSLGFTAPALFSRARREKPARPVWSFTRAEDAALALLFVVSLIVYRGCPENILPEAGNLYGEVPLLLGVGLAALTAFVLVLSARLVLKPDVQLFGRVLKSNKRWKPAGGLVIALFGLWSGFFAHSLVLQSIMLRGELAVSATAALAGPLWSGDAQKLAEEGAALAQVRTEGRSAFEMAGSWGLFSDRRVEEGLAWFEALDGRHADAAARMGRVLEAHPHRHRLRYDRARLLVLAGAILEAMPEFLAAVEAQPEDQIMRAALPHLANDLYAGGFVAQSITVLERARQLDGENQILVSALAEAHVANGNPAASLALLEEWGKSHPLDVHLKIQRAQVLEAMGRAEDALKELAVLHADTGPDEPGRGDARAAFWSAVLKGRQGRAEEADAWIKLGQKRDPNLPDWRKVVMR
jgi:ferredoxin/tetratricopeptide (TPR) repeat protein